MRLDRDQLDRSPIDRDGVSLAYGEFVVPIRAVATLSAAWKNDTFTVTISATSALSATFTANDPSMTVAIAATSKLWIQITPVININSLITSGTIKRSLTDKMYTGSFQFDKTTTAGPSSSIYWTKIYFWMPDYTGAWNLVFVGIVPSSNSKYTAHDGTHLVGDDTIQAYGYDFYLSHQYLPDNLLQIPNRTGIEIMTPDTFVNGCLGCVVAFDPTTKEWYVDDSTTWVYGTGIKPYSINLPGGWGSTLPKTDWIFTTTMTKAEAIEKVCQYTKQIFYVRWQYVSGVWTPCAYLIDEAKLDYAVGSGGLDLPDPVYISNGGSPYDNEAYKYLVSPFTVDQKGEDQYNFFTVRCQLLSGAWIQAVGYTGDPYDEIVNPTGTEIKREYYEENKDIATQTDCNNRLADLMDYYYQQVVTWKCTLNLRSDLVLLQKLYISGYTTMIPDGTYRIIDIEYHYADAGTTNQVTISFINDSQFKAYLNLKRVYTNTIFEIQNVVKNVLAQQKPTVYGVVLSAALNAVTLVFTEYYNSSSGLFLYPYKITSAPMTLPASTYVGIQAQITGINTGTGVITVTIPSTGASYSCTSPDITKLSVNDYLWLSAINANIVVSTTSSATTGKNIKGYVMDANKISSPAAVWGQPDENGNYLFHRCDP